MLCGEVDDRNLYRDLMKEHKEIEPIVEKYRALKKAEASLEDAEAILNDSEADKELRQMASDEMSAAKSDIESISEELKILLLPRDPNDDRSVIVEIRGGAGAFRKNGRQTFTCFFGFGGCGFDFFDAFRKRVADAGFGGDGTV